MKIITKKYKIIVLGDHNSGKSFFLKQLKNNYYKSKLVRKNKCKNEIKNKSNKIDSDIDINNSYKNENADVITTYIPTDGIDFYKYSTKTQLLNSLTKKKENHENIFYLYDASGNKKKSNFNASFIESSQICLLIINPHNYCSIDQLNTSIEFWLNLYLQFLNKETYNIIMITINKSEKTTEQSLNSLKLSDSEYDEITDKFMRRNKTYINTIYLGQYNIKSESASLSEKILREIHNNNILNIMTLSNKKIEHNLKNTKLYFKKEINNYSSPSNDNHNDIHNDNENNNNNGYDNDDYDDYDNYSDENTFLLEHKQTNCSNKKNKCNIM